MRFYPYIKPALDFLFAIILLILLFPLFLIIALAVKLDSKGPIFYLQDRMGKGIKKFTIYKFRTMQDKAREQQKKFHNSPEIYITRIGRILREIRLDELPQLINILKGEMSFIGPRANNVYETEIKEIKANPKRKKRFKVRPGIIGLERLVCVWPEKKKVILSKLPKALALLNLDQEKVDNKLAFDLYYVDHLQFSVDSILLFYTFLWFLKKVKKTVFRI